MHNLETMFSVREKPWHGLGTIVEDAPDSANALKLAGLNWYVEPTKIYANGKEIENYQANVRNSDGAVLGIVTNKYDIVQNEDAFDFTDSLIDTGYVRYETAGSLNGGKTVWLLAKLPEDKILGDSIDKYLVFMNSHDGKGAVKCFCTPVRVVCQNTLSMALESAKRSWSFKHMGDLNSKLEEAKQTLFMADKYIENLKKEAEVLAKKKISDTDIHTVIKTLFPITPEMSERQQNSIKYNKEALLKCFDAPDLANFKNTAWGAINALSDFVSHTDPLRITSTFKEKRFENVVTGHNIFDTGVELLKAI